MFKKIIFVSAILLLLGCEEVGVESAGCEYGIEYRGRCHLWRCNVDGACAEIANLTDQSWYAPTQEEIERIAENTVDDCFYIWDPDTEPPKGSMYTFCEEFFNKENNPPFRENSWVSTDPITGLLQCEAITNEDRPITPCILDL